MVDVKWSTMFPNPTSDVAKVCLNNLKNLWSGKYSVSEFEKEQNYAYLMVINDMRYVVIPAQPDSYREYDDRSKRDEKFDSVAYYKKHPEIEQWLNKSSKITWQNYRNVCILDDLIKFFTSLGDVVSSGKCSDVYNGYPLSIYSGDRQIWHKRSSL